MKALIGCTAIVALVAAFFALSAWVFEILFNAVSQIFHWNVQLDFWQAFVVVLFMSFVGGFFGKASK